MPSPALLINGCYPPGLPMSQRNSTSIWRPSRRPRAGSRRVVPVKPALGQVCTPKTPAAGRRPSALCWFVRILGAYPEFLCPPLRTPNTSQSRTPAASSVNHTRGTRRGATFSLRECTTELVRALLRGTAARLEKILVSRHPLDARLYGA